MLTKLSDDVTRSLGDEISRDLYHYQIIKEIL